jgi:hypothetical protein
MTGLIGTFLVLVMVLSLPYTAGCTHNTESEGMVINEDGTVTIRNSDEYYKAIDRELTVEDFRNLQPGCSLDEVEELFGEPNGWIGSGILSPYYYVRSGEFAILAFRYPVASKDLEGVEIVNATDTVEGLELKNTNAK